MQLRKIGKWEMEVTKNALLFIGSMKLVRSQLDGLEACIRPRSWDRRASASVSITAAELWPRMRHHGVPAWRIVGTCWARKLSWAMQCGVQDPGTRQACTQRMQML